MAFFCRHNYCLVVKTSSFMGFVSQYFRTKFCTKIMIHMLKSPPNLLIPLIVTDLFCVLLENHCDFVKFRF